MLDLLYCGLSVDMLVPCFNACLCMQVITWEWGLSYNYKLFDVVQNNCFFYEIDVWPASKLVCFWYSSAWVGWCCLNALHVCMNAYCMCVSFLFPAIESNDDCAEEGEVFEYQEEGDQGQAQQGKPSTCAYLNLIMSLCIALLLSLLLCIVFRIAMPLI
jgi:hypothetical protein